MAVMLSMGLAAALWPVIFFIMLLIAATFTADPVAMLSLMLAAAPGGDRLEFKNALLQINRQACSETARLAHDHLQNVNWPLLNSAFAAVGLPSFHFTADAGGPKPVRLEPLADFDVLIVSEDELESLGRQGRSSLSWPGYVLVYQTERPTLAPHAAFEVASPRGVLYCNDRHEGEDDSIHFVTPRLALARTEEVMNLVAPSCQASCRMNMEIIPLKETGSRLASALGP